MNGKHHSWLYFPRMVNSYQEEKRQKLRDEEDRKQLALELSLRAEKRRAQRRKEIVKSLLGIVFTISFTGIALILVILFRLAF